VADAPGEGRIMLLLLLLLLLLPLLPLALVRTLGRNNAEEGGPLLLFMLSMVKFFFHTRATTVRHCDHTTIRFKSRPCVFFSSPCH
jgi:hypothetical protein